MVKRYVDTHRDPPRVEQLDELIRIVERLARATPGSSNHDLALTELHIHQVHQNIRAANALEVISETLKKLLEKSNDKLANPLGLPR